MNARLISLMLFLLAFTAQAADRSLYWKALVVNATLTADGTLQVSEYHKMVFNGDWNGGERSFRLLGKQVLYLAGILKVDDDKKITRLQRGNLSEVDHFNWTEGNTLRWRNRLADSPPFVNTEFRHNIVYELKYVLSERDGIYTLDHDFAFPRRDGPIQVFLLKLKLAPEWETDAPLPKRYEAGNLVPGKSYVVKLKLRHSGKIAPLLTPPQNVGSRFKIWFAALGLVTLLFLFYVIRESRLGRYRLIPTSDINEAFLKKHLFGLRAEVVGAIWDHSISQAEVSATILRFAAEGKISTAPFASLKNPGEVGAQFKLLVPREQFEGYELNLINWIFPGEKTEVNTDSLLKKGTSPIRAIEKRLWAYINKLPELDKKELPARRVPSLVMAAVGMVVGAAGFYLEPAPGALPLLAFSFFLNLFVFGTMAAAMGKMRRSLLWPKGNLILIYIMALAPFTISFLISLGTDDWANLYVFSGTLVFFAALANWWLEKCKTNTSREYLQKRVAIASARRFFKKELTEPLPKLKDDWLPYVAAVGLTSHLVKWKLVSGRGSSSGGSSSFSERNISTTEEFTGGGGNFAGAGATAEWISANTSTSGAGGGSGGSSGGGGGGGGGSSGGGGGGGW